MKKLRPRRAKSRTQPKRGKPKAPRKAPTAARKAAQAGGDSFGQSELFGKAAGLFQRGKFAEAKALFERAAEGPLLAVGHAARTHARMCDLRIATTPPEPQTAEEHYNLAVALLNERSLREAEEHLDKALGLSPGGDHIHYALALSRGLRGDFQGAEESLRKAIRLRPRNRGQALHDPDFAELVRRPEIADLLMPREDDAK